MKPARVPQAAPDAPVRVEFQVQFSGGSKGRRQARRTASTTSRKQESPATTTISPAPQPAKKASLSRVPKITRLLVLGHYFENLVREGVVKDYAEIARLTGLSRARVTQITNLTLLAPEIQEALLSLEPILDGREQISEHNLRRISAETNWRRNSTFRNVSDLVLPACQKILARRP